MDQGRDGFRSELGVLGDLDQGSRSPSYREEKKRGGHFLPISKIETCRTTCGFDEHERGDDVGHPGHVAGVIVVKGLTPKLGE
jgi:hypothetical protein